MVGLSSYNLYFVLQRDNIITRCFLFNFYAIIWNVPSQNFKIKKRIHTISLDRMTNIWSSIYIYLCLSLVKVWYSFWNNRSNFSFWKSHSPLDKLQQNLKAFFSSLHRVWSRIDANFWIWSSQLLNLFTFFKICVQVSNYQVQVLRNHLSFK